MPRLKVADCDANCCTLCTSTDCLWCFLLLVVFSIAPVFEPKSLWFVLVEADNFKGCTDRCLVHQLRTAWATISVTFPSPKWSFYIFCYDGRSECWIRMDPQYTKFLILNLNLSFIIFSQQSSIIRLSFTFFSSKQLMVLQDHPLLGPVVEEAWQLTLHMFLPAKKRAFPIAHCHVCLPNTKISWTMLKIFKYV